MYRARFSELHPGPLGTPAYHDRVYEPDTLYARLGEARIAYQVVGSGPVDLVSCSGYASIDAEWDEPEIASYNRRVGEFARLIRFDNLGSGASDPVPQDGSPPLENAVDQLLAVMDAADSQRAVLLGGDSGTASVLLAAASHPDRVLGLTIFHGAARWIAADDYPHGLPLEEMEMWEGLFDTMEADQILTMSVPSRADDEQFLRWGRKWLRSMTSPAAMRAILREAVETDVRALLPSITVPTLVLHRTDYQGLPLALSRYLADHIPDGRFLEIPGEDGPPWFDHPEVIIGALRDFVAEIVGGDRTTARAERTMATVLFTDLVSSTERAQQVGDAEWRHLLQLHEEISQRAVRDHGGKLVKKTGDGIMATFDGPGRALHCAGQLGRSLARLGLPIRAGVHTGEIELLGDDIGGVGVHIAARVMAAARPGEVLVSRTVRDLVVGSELTFEDRGSHTLKGVDGPWQLFVFIDG